MPQTQQLIDTLKKALRGQRKTYADVARTLELSEASVKRLFSESSLSLQRLEQICQMLDMEISDLVQLMNQQARRIDGLNRKQEQEIASDRLLLLVTVCVLNRWTMADILAHYDVKEVQIIRCLTRLDKLKIIDLLPGNRVKLLVSNNFQWIKDGPIQRFFQSAVEKDFFSSRFDAQTEKLMFVNGMLSKKSNAIFQRKLERLVREFDELNDDDAGLPLDQRFGTSVCLAIREWEYGLFADLRK